MKESSIVRLKIPPPIVTIIFSLFMYSLDQLVPYKIEVIGGDWLIGLLLFFSVVLLMPAVIQFYQNKTTINPLKPETTKVLVVKGCYRYSRNPMYLGMALILFAWCIFIANPLNILLAAGYIFYINYFQIRVEEVALETIFGDDFKQYKKRVRRWL